MGHKKERKRDLTPIEPGKKVITHYYVLLPKPKSVSIVGFVLVQPILVTEPLSLSKNVFPLELNEFGKCWPRADSGFFDGALLEVLEEKKSEYLIKVKMKNLTSLLMSQKWQKVRGKKGIESCEFTYKCYGWKTERRLVAIRKEVDLATETRTLFPLPQYEFFCYVTNLKLSPWKIHKCYGKRSTSENWIEWCKNHLASGTIRTQDFWANSARFQTSILAYNLMVWMMWLNTKTRFHEEPNTIRAWLIQVPVCLIRLAYFNPNACSRLCF
jgi:hypothetical protein